MNFKHEKDKELMFLKFKFNKDRRLFSALHPIVIMIYMDVVTYAHEKYNKKPYITSTISSQSEDDALKRTSDSHQYGICIDFGFKLFTDTEIKDIEKHFNGLARYEKYKYLTYSGEYRLIKIHDNGNGRHAHLGIHRKYAKEKFYNLRENSKELKTPDV